MKLGLTALRLALGAVFFAHGTQKLFGWFGGPGLDNLAKGFDSMGLKPGKRNAALAAAAETGGGALFALGLATPVAAAGTIGVMNQAIRSVHLSKGFFSTQGGYEFNLVLIAAAVALADAGPGEFSLDEALGLKLHGPLWALAALGAGLAGPQLLERALPAPTEPAPEPPRMVPEPEPQTAAA
jgi:putative oxidoreductase